MIKTDVSIIIVNYRSAELVINCINSIFEKTEDITFEIIVVDNASGDDSVEVLRNTFGGRIGVIVAGENLGFGKANNLGSQSAKGEYLLLLNPDTILVNNAIKVLHEAMVSNPNYGVVGGNLYMSDMSPAPSYCLHFDSLETEKKNALWSTLLRNKVCEKLSSKKGLSPSTAFNYTERPMQVAYIFGADMMMKKSLFDSIGGFDSDFFMYYEEEELTWRITQKGYPIFSIPDAKIIHLDGATVKTQNSFSEKQFRMRMTGALTYYKKRYGDIGVSEFVNYRCKRYERLIRIAKVQNKLTDDFPPVIQKRILHEVFDDSKR